VAASLSAFLLFLQGFQTGPLNRSTCMGAGRESSGGSAAVCHPRRTVEQNTLFEDSDQSKHFKRFERRRRTRPLLRWDGHRFLEPESCGLRFSNKRCCTSFTDVCRVMRPVDQASIWHHCLALNLRAI